MARIGGEIEQLGQLKSTFDRESRTVEELTRVIRGQLQTTVWEGPAAERFRSMWSGEFEVSLRKLQEALVEAGTEVSRRQTALLQAGSWPGVSRSTEQPEVFLPTLAAELPHGWTVTESTTLRSPSGTEIRVWLDHASDERDLYSVADGLEASARGEVGQIGEVRASDVELGPRSAHVRRFTFERAGEPCVGRIVCAAEGARVLIASAAWRLENDEIGAAEMDAAIAGVRLLDTPVTAPAVANEVNSPRPTSGSSQGLDTGRWSSVIDAWAAEPFTAPEPEQSTRWAPAELAVMAAFMGVGAFPTVGVEWLAGLPSSSVDAIIDTVARSMIARGLLGHAEDGTAVCADDLRPVFEAPLRADLVIDIVHMQGDRTLHTWIGATVDQATRVAVTDDGTRRIDHLAPERVVAAILSGAADCGRGSADLSPPHDRITESTVRDHGSDMSSLTRITTTWRRDGRLHGGAFSWAQDGAGNGWMAEPAGSEWTLRPSARLHSVLLEHLPSHVGSTDLK